MSTSTKRIDARRFTIQLGGKWHGSYGCSPCPVCQHQRRPDQNALSLRDGENGVLLAKCHKTSCDFADILAAAKVSDVELLLGSNKPLEIYRTGKQFAASKAKLAWNIWQEAKPIQGTLAETYLRSRGIDCPLPKTLRYHPNLWHSPSKQFSPAMVALIEGTNSYAVHRTYLSQNGMAKIATQPAKMMLGATAGSAVRLSDECGPLVIAEGIETALSLRCGLLNHPFKLWAALSATGLSSLTLPQRSGQLIIANDGDRAGTDEAVKLADRASLAGWQVSLLPAPQGCDWNDVLRGSAEQ